MGKYPARNLNRQCTLQCVLITAVCTRGLIIKGSIRYLAGCYPAAIDLISSGQVDVKRLITNRYKFEEAEQAFELVKAGRQDVFKVMIAGVGF